MKTTFPILASSVLDLLLVGFRLRLDTRADQRQPEEVALEEGLAQPKDGGEGVEDDGEAAERRNQRRGREAERGQVDELLGETGAGVRGGGGRSGPGREARAERPLAMTAAHQSGIRVKWMLCRPVTGS